ncbi:hypothetical protein [Microbacterium murale]|uniref:Uncharacterized protein n=1 Tax=Microbacterium murale TaxID=1081040 RepID=A0ABU0PB46_9MICO|nr:hypothetical protein [Microbacterium murale]MDQ0644560.1 hypothetical protein [Microbacterium murale]
MDRQVQDRQTFRGGLHASPPPGTSKADRRRRRRQERRLARHYRSESRFVTRLKQLAVGVILTAGSLLLVYAFFIYK